MKVLGWSPVLLILFSCLTPLHGLFIPAGSAEKGNPVVALVLAGGGSRGFAHIGVIKALDREGIDPRIVVGTSMGSVIGGFYAAGMGCAEMEKMALSMDWNVMFNDLTDRRDKFFTQKKGGENHIFEFRFRNAKIVIPTALISGQLLVNFIVERTLAADYQAGFDFDRLPRRYRALATDLYTGESVVLKQGCLAEAMRASLAVPFAFTPFPVKDRMLIDGGFRNILPVDVAKAMGADFIIAVDIRPVLYTEKELQNPLTFIDQVVAICLLNQEGRPIRDSAVVIQPDLGRQQSMDYTGIAALIAAGERAAELNMPEIRGFLDSLRKSGLPKETLAVQSIRIENLKYASYNEMFELLNLKPGQRLSLDEARRAAERVRETGYFDSVWVEIKDVPAGNALEFRVLERPLLERIEFSGNTVFSSEELERLFPLKAGGPANPVLTEKGVKIVLSKYRERGYVLAGVTPVTENGRLRLIIREGRIDRIVVKGNLQTGEEVILREAGMMQGTLFSVRQMEKDVRNLYATGLFEYVYVNLDETEKGVVVAVNVKEKAHEAFQLGLRYDTIRMLEGFIRFGSLNFARRGYVLNGTLHYGLRREKYLLAMRTDRLFYTFLTAEGDLYYYRDRKYVVDALDSTRFTFNTLRKMGGFISVAHQILKAGKLSFVFQLEHYKSNQDEADIGPLKKYQGIRMLSLRSEFDTYDAPVFPVRGFKLYSAADFGLDIIGRHDAFFDYTMTASGALTPIRRHTFIPAMYMSLADAPLPDPQKNYLGGSTELRMNDDVLLFNSFPLFGYPEQAFTGEYLMALCLSYRLQLPRGLYFLLHGNLGNTWDGDYFKWGNFTQHFFGDSFKGAGASLALDIPRLGEARFTACTPFLLSGTEQERKFGETYYFSIGHDF